MIEYNISIKEYLEALGIEAKGSISKKLIVCKNPEHYHRKHTPSLSINYDDAKGTFKYYCFGVEHNGEPCSLRGSDFVKFYSIIEGVPYLQAKSELINSSGGYINSERGELFPKKEQKKPGCELPKIISEITMDNYPEYLLNRGFTYEQTKIFNPFFSPEINKYLLLPIYDETGKQISLVGRITDDNLSKKYPDEFPRYDNPYESQNKQLLYGLWLPKISKQLFIVEGPFDVIGTYVNGFSVLGVFGIKFNLVQVSNIIKFFKKNKFEEIVVFFDYNTKNETRQMIEWLSPLPTSYIEIEEKDEDIDAGNIDKEYLLELFGQRKFLQRKTFF